MALWRLFFHFVWATKERLPLITTEIEQLLYGYIIGKSDSLGCITHAIGGIEDHIHTVVSIPPRLSIADFVKNVKGSSAHYINHGQFNYSNKFAWQKGYGVFSLGEKRLDKTIEYVLNQKNHHKDGQVISQLEKINEEDDCPGQWNEGKATKQIKIISTTYEEA